MTDSEQAIENAISNLCWRITDLPSPCANQRDKAYEHITLVYSQAVDTLCKAKERLANAEYAEVDLQDQRQTMVNELLDRIAEENCRKHTNL